MLLLILQFIVLSPGSSRLASSNPCRYQGKYFWELQDHIAYWQEFEQPKIARACHYLHSEVNYASR
jgi:hypothetical protein